jgi:hypothetical protein
MTRRWLALLLVGIVGLGGLLAAQEPRDDEPVRLKKKNKGPEEKEPAEPKKQPDKKVEVEPKEKEPAGQPAVPPEPGEDEREVLARINRNMRKVEDQLLNKELTDGTIQTEDDILKDLDDLIKRNDDPQGGGGGGGGQDNQENQDMNQDNKGGMDQQGGQEKNQGGMGQQGGQPKPQAGQGQGQQRGQGRSTGLFSRRRGGQQQQQQARSGRGKGGQQTAQGNPMGQGTQQGNPMQGQGNQGSTSNPMNLGGQNKPDGIPDRTADLNKDAWGHLPETVRAQMNAFANREEYMAKHRDLIKQYYRIIAEQGSREK